MERDSRRGQGQWRGCHSFNNIICDGEDTSSRVPRSGGLKMGSVYYYYYELDGITETHDPSLPSTTACPYLPGQRVNTLRVPHEQPSRLRSASTSSLESASYQTLNPSDRFMTPRLPPAVPDMVPATSATATKPAKKAPSRSAPVSASSTVNPSTWLPRRLFVRRPSPVRKATSVEDQDNTDIVSPVNTINTINTINTVNTVNSTAISPNSPENDNMLRAPRLVSWASSSSLTSLRRPAAPSQCSYYSTTSSQSRSGSRSRDISPDSLRRFLVEDVPAAMAEDTASQTGGSFAIIDDEDEDEDEDDEHNFATSAVSETAPITVLSPPPPMRPVTPVPQAQTQAAPAVPEPPARAPPAVPTATATATAAAHHLQISPATANTPLQLLPLQPPLSPMSPFLPTSPASPPLPALSYRSSGLLGCSSVSETDEDEDVDYLLEAFLPPPQAPGGGHLATAAGTPNISIITTATSPNTTPTKPDQVQHDGLVAALDARSPLSPGGRLGDLVDELGWMATAIEG